MDQWTREIPIVAERGKVVDRNGVVLADNNTAYTIFARSNAVKEVEKTALALSSTLGVEQAKLYEKLTKKKAWQFLEQNLMFVHLKSLMI